MTGTVRTVLLAAAATLALAPPALAQDPVPTPTPTPPAPTPAPAPAAAKLRIAVKTPYRDGRRRLALRGDKVAVTGSLKPYVAGQKVAVRVLSGGKRLPSGRSVTVKPGGTFTVHLRPRRTGSLAIQATHAATPGQGSARTAKIRVLVARPSLGFGSRGTLTRIFQRKLQGLHYAAYVTGRFDDRTGRAVMAWRKVNRRARVYTADAGVVRGVLAGRGGWKVRHPHAGHHVEADISLQALALIDGKRVVHVYHTSSGAPATPTVLGHYRFYSKTAGTNAKGMVDSNYFIRGYAIHGYVDVPPYNASHGCLRVPIPDARTIYDWIRLGDEIFVEP